MTHFVDVDLLNSKIANDSERFCCIIENPDRAARAMRSQAGFALAFKGIAGGLSCDHRETTSAKVAGIGIAFAYVAEIIEEITKGETA